MSDSLPYQLIHRASGDPKRVERLGPYHLEALLRREEAVAGTVYRVRLEPHSKTGTSWHRLAEEYYFVLAGSGTAWLDGAEHQLKAGDFLRLPPGVRHAFAAGPDGLDMLDIHTPGCYPDHDTYFAASETNTQSRDR